MPNSRPPSIYGIPIPRLYIAGRGPIFISPGFPLAIPKKLTTNGGAAVANRGKMKVSANTYADWSHQQRINRRKPARPPGLFHLAGVNPRDADEEKEAHGQLQGLDDRPRSVVTDERTSGGWIGWMPAKMIPAAIAAKPAQRMRLDAVIFSLLSSL